MFNTNTEHPLVARQQTYMLDRKLVSISSEDRDQCQWKNRAHFEITLPQQLLNVETIRLVECNFPSNNYTLKIIILTRNFYFRSEFRVLLSSLQLQKDFIHPNSSQMN